MASSFSPLLREQRNQFLMNGALIATALVGGTAVTNERGLFVPVGIHNAISATAQAFAAIATPEGLRRLMTNSMPFGVPGQTATPLGRLTISSGIPLPSPEEETMAWMPQESAPGDTAERLAGAAFPTVTNGELLAANTPVGPDGAPASGGAAGGDAGGAGQPTFTAANDVPAGNAPPVQTFQPPFASPSLPLPPILLALADPAPVTVGLPPEMTGAPPANTSTGVPLPGATDGSSGSPTGVPMPTPPIDGGGPVLGPPIGNVPLTPTPPIGGGVPLPTPGQTPQAASNDPPVSVDIPSPVQGAVPEPAAWAMLIGGFGLLGLVQRLGGTRRRRAAEDAEIAALLASEEAKASR